MKRFILILLCCIFVFLLTACRNGNISAEDPFGEPEETESLSPFVSQGAILSVEPSAGESSEPSDVAPTLSPTVSLTPTPTVAPSVTPSAEAEKVTYVRVQTDGLRVRAKASTASTVLGSLDRGDMVVFLGKENGFYKTWYKEKVGYVAASYCDFFAIVKGSSKVEKTLDFAYTLLGYPYVWGSVRYHDGDGLKNAAFTGEEFDCSALVQYVYYAACKVKLGTTTREQVKNGTAVSKSKIRRGDLLFFTNADRAHLSGNERIGHVAIYLGENYILHTASDYAVIEPVSSARWANYITARRVV